MSRRAVFLDRDGTLLRDVGYLSRLADLEVLPGVADALCSLWEAGFLRLVVTNQSGVARGLVAPAFPGEVHGEVRRRVRAAGADLEGCYVCPHHPEFTGPCSCRKPLPGMILTARQEWGLDLGSCWVVGDKADDVRFARNAGCRAALVRTGRGRDAEEELRAAGEAADLVADGLAQAVARILGARGREGGRRRDRGGEAWR